MKKDCGFIECSKSCMCTGYFYITIIFHSMPGLSAPKDRRPCKIRHGSVSSISCEMIAYMTASTYSTSYVQDISSIYTRYIKMSTYIHAYIMSTKCLEHVYIYIYIYSYMST